MNSTAKVLLDGVLKQMDRIYQKRPGLYTSDQGEVWLEKERELVQNLNGAKNATQMRVHCRKFIDEFKRACAKHKKDEPVPLNRKGDPLGTIYSLDGEVVGRMADRAAVEMAERPEDHQRG